MWLYLIMNIHRYASGYTSIQISIHRYHYICTSINRFTQVYISIHRFTPVFTGKHHYTQVHISICQYLQIYTCIYRYTQVYTSIYRYTQIYLSIQICILWSIAWSNRFILRLYSSICCIEFCVLLNDAQRSYYEFLT